MEKDYSLLRPFDLEAAKRGDRVSYADLSGDIIYLAGPDPKGIIAYQSKEMIYTAPTHAFRMTPLAWVKGRPVYPFDVMYGKMSGRKFIVPNGVIYYDDFTWEKPKTKREGWINIYPNTNAFHYETKEDADRLSASDRIACCRIEWEE